MKRSLIIFRTLLQAKVGPARNGMLSLLQSIVGIGVYFLVMRYVVKLTGLEGLGLWSLTMGFVSMVRLMDLSGANGIARMIAVQLDDEEAQVSYIDSLSLLVGGLFFVLCLVGYYPLLIAITASIEPSTVPLAEKLLFWAVLSLPINVIGVAQLSSLDGVGRADIRAVINILGFLLFAVLVGLLIAKNGILALAYAQFSQYLFVLIVARVFLTRRIGGLSLWPRSFDRHAAGDSLQYGLRLQAASFPMALFDPMMRILLGRWAGLEFLGIYDLSYKLAGYIRTMIQASIQPMLPEFARLYNADLARARTSYTDLSGKIVLVSIGSWSGLILASPFLSIFLLSEIYPIFIFSVSVLSLAWGVATFGLPTQLFSRAVGIFRWSILGQWSIVGLGTTFVFVAQQWLGEFWLVAGISIAIVIGHLFAMLGEMYSLELNPFGAVAKTPLVLGLVFFLGLGLGAASYSAVLHFGGN